MASRLESQNGEQAERHRSRFRSFFGWNSGSTEMPADAFKEERGDVPTKWSMGVLNDKLTHEVPGSVLLLANLRNEPLGLRNTPARASHSSLPSPFPAAASRRQPHATSVLSSAGKKKTPDGAIVLEPQPEDSDNDPLNWPAWRRDLALLSLGFYCMVGGGITPILAAGFTDVAKTYGVTVHEVALTTGLYMMGMGVGSVIASPTAILYGKRPVYLVSCVLFIGTTMWCAASPSYASLAAARVLQGMAVSPVECLPSATIAEIFFLHERAFRLGIYTLLLLGGKNLVPLASAVVINSMGWRWVFWIVAMIVGACWFLLFFFVPETFWDRTPRPKSRFSSRIPSIADMYHSASNPKPSRNEAGNHEVKDDEPYDGPSSPTSSVVLVAPSNTPATETPSPRPGITSRKSAGKSPLHVVFSVSDEKDCEGRGQMSPSSMEVETSSPHIGLSYGKALHPDSGRVEPRGVERTDSDYMDRGRNTSRLSRMSGTMDGSDSEAVKIEADEKARKDSSPDPTPGHIPRYTTVMRKAPKRSFVQQLRPWEGRLRQENWFKAAFRPFLLYAYPAVLWSAVIYSCSVGWLIVISESMALIYRDKDSYNFSALSTGLVYLSPFIGGVLGTAVAGKMSDIVVMAMAKRNGGLYEPEFRLIMAIPTALSTVIGLMGFGWSAEEKDNFWIPTFFFGLISFGCSLGSTTAITFCVDSYRQYAGEALVTLNFSKNIFHGLVFSLFVVSWLESNGPKQVYICLGAVQLAALLTTIPMYIYGKRARMWTVRKNMMEKF